MAYKARKRKVKKNVPEGKAYIHSTFNNTIVTLSDKEGNAISWASAGTLGFKGSKKSTPFAAGMAAEAAGKAAFDMGMRKVEVYVKGLGSAAYTNSNTYLAVSGGTLTGNLILGNNDTSQKT